MKNPFPGMNPYFEGDRWKGLHNELITWMVEQINAQLSNQYIVVIEEEIVLETLLDVPDRTTYGPDVRIDKRSNTPPVYIEEFSEASVATPTINLPAESLIEHEIPILKYFGSKIER